MAHNDHVEPSIVDVRLAMEDCGVILPEMVFEEQEWRGTEDTRGVDEFILWCASAKNREIKRIALDGEQDTDYLDGMLRLS